jgi:succinate-semialdehyde dehydrogenase / glutarate-semialdehyde dehydrogenase
MTLHQTLALADPSLMTDKAFVAGEWIEAPDGRCFGVTDPFDNALIAEVPELGPETVRRAIDAAHAAQRDWSRRTAKERAGILRRWYELIIANADDLASILTAEQGKPLAEAKGEVVFNAGYIEWFAEQAKRIEGDILPAANGSQRVLVLKQPVGVCAAITPWNFPNGMITRKLGPALAAGCTMVVKPAAQTPLSALALAVLAERAGVPKGALSIITSNEPEAVGEEFCHNPKVAKISFTGSTAVGRWLMREASGTIKRLSLELGGNAPFIVFDDADIDAAVEGAMVSKFRNTGQTCVCANRIYVHTDIHDRFVDKFAAAVSSLRVGDPMDPATQIGPLVDAQGLAKVRAHVDDALSKGAAAVVGGTAAEGLVFKPTVLTSVKRGMRLLEEETFGPVAPIVPFTDDNDAVRQANNTPFGLAAYLWTRDLSRAFHVAEALDYGIIGVNDGIPSTAQAPFGGMKMSGVGREGGPWGIEEYLDIKYMSIGLGS